MAGGLLVLGFPDYEEQSYRLAQRLDARYETVHVHRFPDGESLVRLPEALAAHVVLCRSLDRPNDKLVEFLLAAATARELGAERLTLVTPYLCYMRQDQAFAPGEAVSQRIIGEFIADLFDAVVTVDPHLHRIKDLNEVIPERRVAALSSAALMSAFLGRQAGNPFLLGPDSESRQWVQAVAKGAGLDYGVASKERIGDREVRITLSEQNVAGREVVIIDDVVSTGTTLAETARAAYAGGAARVDVLVTHALFAGDAEQGLKEAGVAAIWSTDSIPHASNVISLAELLAEAIS